MKIIANEEIFKKEKGLKKSVIKGIVKDHEGYITDTSSYRFVIGELFLLCFKKDNNIIVDIITNEDTNEILGGKYAEIK